MQTTRSRTPIICCDSFTLICPECREPAIKGTLEDLDYDEPISCEVCGRTLVIPLEKLKALHTPRKAHDARRK